MNTSVACLSIEALDTSAGASSAPSTKGLAILAEAFYRFSPQIAVREPRFIFIEIGKSRQIFDARLFRLKALALCRRFGHTPRITIAEHPGLALALTRLKKFTTTEEAIMGLPLTALIDIAMPFETAKQNPERAKKISEMLVLLQKMGLRTVADFRRLPPKQILSRFGRDGLMVYHAFEAPPLWPRFQLPQKIFETWDFLDAPHSIDSILFCLKHLLDRMTARLWARSEKATALRLIFNCRGPQSTQRCWDINVPTPQSSALNLLAILRERLYCDLAHTPLREDLLGLTLEMTETIASKGSQRSFFNQSEEDQENWGVLVSRLQSKLGPQNVFMAELRDSHVPEQTWARATRKTPQTTPIAICAPRPTRLLKNPEPCLLLVRSTFSDCLDLTTNLSRAQATEALELISQSRRKSWQIISQEGPERLSGLWWQAPPNKSASQRSDPKIQSDTNHSHKSESDQHDHRDQLMRDYYILTATTGERLWVFKQDDQSFFLHGFFD